MVSVVGRTLGNGRYRIDRLLGKGGQGSVYRGMHLMLNTPIAVKVLSEIRGDNRTARARFEREAKRSAQLRHPNIVVVHDFAYESGLYYIVNEFIEGTNLKEMLEKSRGPLPAEIAWPIIEQIGQALAYAHRQGMVHRDVKPANILLDAANKRAVLCDFGLARMQEDEDISVSTEVRGRMGSPLYMSPEQCLGNTTDSRTDLYSFALVVYEVFCGRHALRGPSDTSSTIQFKQVNQPPPDARSVNPNVSRRQAAALKKALAKNPDDRFDTVDEFLHAFSHGPGPSIPAALWIPVASVAAVAVVLWSLYTYTDLFRPKPTPAPIAKATETATIAPRRATVVPTTPAAPSPVLLSAPELVEPTDGASVSNDSVALEWACTYTLEPDEQFMITVSRQGDAGSTVTQRSTAHQFRPSLSGYGTYQWSVSIVRWDADGQQWALASVPSTEGLFHYEAPTDTPLPTDTPAPAATASRTPTPTATPVPATAVPRVVIRIVGLDEWGIGCTTLVFNADGVETQIALDSEDVTRTKQGNSVTAQLTWPHVGTVTVLGGPNGDCPWTKWYSGLDPTLSLADYDGSEVTLAFVPTGSNGGGGEDDPGPDLPPGWH